jgi:hypothetical protein
MALIAIEFRRPTFETAIQLVAKAGRAVPVPTLPPLGDDRLILTFDWQGQPTIETGFDSFAPPAGSILLKYSVVLTHASVAEIRLQPDTPGVSATGTVWLLATATLSEVMLTLVGFDPGTGPVPLAAPPRLGTLPLPKPQGAGIVAAALVASPATVTLRLATSASDNPLHPPANRLQALHAESATGTTNWLIHLPAELFVEMVLQPLISRLSSLPDGMVIEEALRASWVQHESGDWGVSASVGLKQLNACPGLFGGVDMSVDVKVSAQFKGNLETKAIDVALAIEVDASDWDSFRCWLGSAGFVSFGLGLFDPIAGFVATIASLTVVGEVVRSDVGAQTKALGVRDFTEVSRTASAVSYSGSFPVEPVPFSSDVSFRIGPAGIDILGTALLVAPEHATSFNPDRGPLVGSWNSEINCSNRSMDHSFAFQDVMVADMLKPGGGEKPVTVYLTSVAEPAGKCWIEMSDARPKLPVRIKAPGMRVGDKGLVILHTSAGLRAYALAPLQAIPAALPGSQRFVNLFCDTHRIRRMAIEVQELRWVEPPPDHGWGHDPLRQWQLVIDGVAEGATIEVRATSGDSPLLATAADFTISAGRAAIEIVTDASTDLVLQAANAGSGASVSLTTRWLLPQHRETFDAPVQALSKTMSKLELRTGAGTRGFDLDRWIPEAAVPAPTGRSLAIEREGQTLPLRANRVLLIHQGDLVIATPLNTLTRGGT